MDVERMIAPMSDAFGLKRFIDAQQETYGQALGEISAGAKQSHWMWFVFPQLAGLGRSPMAQLYAIGSIAEARAFLGDPVLGPRLRRCTEALLAWAGRRSAEEIMGPVDALKLRSSLTLFERVDRSGLFADALARFYQGRRDERTLALLNAQA